MHPDLLNALIVGEHSKRDLARYVLPVAWLLGIIAIAGPTWKLEPNPFVEDAQPLMILLNSDKSMLQTDSTSTTHMERAQLKIADLAKTRKGQPLGLIAYAGSAHLVLPPTADTAVVAEMAAEISPDIMPVPGDRLDLAIQKAAALLREESHGGSLLVIANTVAADPQTIASANQTASPVPIQFLALADADLPETKTLQDAAERLDANVQELTIDDQDVSAITESAERNASAGIAGESSRWQEAGYWLTPLLALVVALSFRRRELAEAEKPS
ncbi:VWA domain-containing protein [Symmachiella macrocystis]|nr:VWA domain-containing protein [Symmachiella macrocystis]